MLYLLDFLNKNAQKNTFENHKYCYPWQPNRSDILKVIKKKEYFLAF